MNDVFTKTISGNEDRAETAATPIASSLQCRTRRRSPAYSSAGICPVFQERLQRSQIQRSP